MQVVHFILLLLPLIHGRHTSRKNLQSPPRASQVACSNVTYNERFDCHPEPQATEEVCLSRGCCWLIAGDGGSGVPWCFYPKGYNGYSYVNVTKNNNGIEAYLERDFLSAYPEDVETIRIDFEYQTDYRLRVKIYDSQSERFESPYPKIPEVKNNSTKARSYTVHIDETKPGFIVSRTNGDLIFDSQERGGFIFAKQFLQLSAAFVGDIYGIGEHRTNLMLDQDWTKFTLFNRDIWPKEDTNLYGSHPFYMVVDPNGNSHGVFLKNSHAMEYQLQPLPAVTLRALGGVFDFYFFLGPTPADVIRQYTELIGRPFMPPYWSLGFHLSRWGYDNIDNMREVWRKTREAGIPYDVQWSDIDYMSRNSDFTYDTNNYATLPQFLNELHDAGMYWVPIIDAGVSGPEPNINYPPYDKGIEMDIFVKDDKGEVFVAKVWNPVSTVYPDFTNPKTNEYYTDLLKDMYQEVPFDGIWIDMNEPSNFNDGLPDGCPTSEWDNPPYTPPMEGGKLFSKTVCMSAQQIAGRHYQVHNLFGISQAEVTQRSLTTVTGKRPFVLSRSTFAGSGKYTAHWSGDNDSTWYSLLKSIQEVLTSSMFGMSMVGADICGFNSETTESLCIRWTQLGAFYPFARNHNVAGAKSQDPVSLGPEVADIAKKVLRIRYSLLPYLYTLLYRAHVYGETVARPLFFEYPADKNTHSVDRSFLWGSGLYIIPVLEDGATSVTAYLPAGRWYGYHTHGKIDSTGSEITLYAPLDVIPLLVRGGTIIPQQEPSTTTKESRKNPLSLLVASNTDQTASGLLFWDDGDSIDTIEKNAYGLISFYMSGRTIKGDVVRYNTEPIPHLSTITILGVDEIVSSVQFNGNNVSFIYDIHASVLTIQNLDARIDQPFTVTWS